MKKTKAEMEEYYGCDPPNVRSACLSCEKTKCDNCMERIAKERQPRRRMSRKENKIC